MEQFSGSIIYDEESVKLLDATLQRTFYYWRRYVIFAICIFFIGLGLQFGINNGVGLISIIIGCLLAPYAANYVMPGAAARVSIEAIKGKRILMEYQFRSSDFVCITGKQENIIRYDRIVRLIDHKDHYYLCTGITQACMIDKRSLKPDSGDKFRSFIEKKCDLKWTTQPTVLSLNFKTIKYNRANTKLERAETSQQKQQQA